MPSLSNIWRPALMLAAIALLAAALLAGLDRLTRDRIEAQRRAHSLQTVSAMLEPGGHDNDLLADTTTLPLAGQPQPATVYRARLGGVAQAAVIELNTSTGYSGSIGLLVAVDMAGTVLGVRVTEHRETPGLGDLIEAERSDWIRQFDGRSLNDPAPERWTPDRRGGEFDTLTGATISSAAVTGAVRQALEAFMIHRDRLFD